MKDKTLMNLMINTPNFIREKLLTDSEIETFKMVKNRGRIGISSWSLAEEIDVSVQSASARLKNLYRKKYLSRREVVAESGGIEYVYETDI